MKPTFTNGATHNFTKPANWDAVAGGETCGSLQARAEVFGDNVLELFTTWKPNADEIAHINAGGVIEVGLCQAGMPVMQVRVVEPILKDVSVLEEYLKRNPNAQPIMINEDGHGF